MGRTNRVNRTNKMYKNKDIEQSKKYAERRNEIITYRLLIFFGIAVCAVSFFIYAMNIPQNAIKSLDRLSFAVLIITGILLILSFVFLVYRNRQSVDESERVIHSKSLFVIAILLFLSDLLIYFTRQKWIPVLTAFVITVTILAYIYYLYQREFFYFSFFTAMGCFFLYFTSSQFLSPAVRMGFRALLFAGAVFVLISALLFMKSKGQLKIRAFNVNIKILEKNSRYVPFFILSVFIAGLAAASFFSINFFYLICALIVYFVIVGIYFTVKMI